MPDREALVWNTGGVPLVAVCGIPGAGKSAVYTRVKSLGLDAWDTDEDGLSAWRDRETKQPVPDPINWHDPDETHGIEYRVRRERVEELHRRARDHTVYLCGCAGGEEEFWELLDRVVILSVDDETLRFRLATRTTNNFGKASHERDATLDANRGWTESYEARGAIVIDATQPLDDVVSEVLRVGER